MYHPQDFHSLVRQRHEDALAEAHTRRLAKHAPTTRKSRKLGLFNLAHRGTLRLQRTASFAEELTANEGDISR